MRVNTGKCKSGDPYAQPAFASSTNSSTISLFGKIYGAARVAKLADAPDLGSGGAILRGSSPLPGSSQARMDPPASLCEALWAGDGEDGR
jgi:hypothetical protein